MALQDAKDFVPALVLESGGRAYGTMLVGLQRCGGCNKWMVEPLSSHKPFPFHYQTSFEKQCAAAGWAINGYATKSVGDREVPICRACKAADVGSFKCALCEQERKSSQSEEVFGFGDGADHLCKPCYETTPAKAWNEKCDELEKSHQYDHC